MPGRIVGDRSKCSQHMALDAVTRARGKMEGLHEPSLVALASASAVRTGQASQRMFQARDHACVHEAIPSVRLRRRLEWCVT
jgi:hypothetical protein